MCQYSNKTMDPKIIAAFGLLCLCSISSSIAASTGISDDTSAGDSGGESAGADAGADDSEIGADTTPAATTTPSQLHICVQSERNWINGKITNDGWTKLQGEEAMSCTMTDTELEPCNVAQTNWIDAVIEQGTHSPAQAERAMNNCAR